MAYRLDLISGATWHFPIDFLVFSAVLAGGTYFVTEEAMLLVVYSVLVYVVHKVEANRKVPGLTQRLMSTYTRLNLTKRGLEKIRR